MRTYNDHYCNTCANLVKTGMRYYCKLTKCKRIPIKRPHANQVEFIPGAGILVVRSRHYSGVNEIILAKEGEPGKIFRDVKEQ